MAECRIDGSIDHELGHRRVGWTSTNQADIELGASVARSLARPWDWVHRISETITYIGVRRVRRQVRLEIEILEGFATKDPEAGFDVALVPLLSISKPALVAWNCVDESGVILTTLTSDESAFVTWSTLVAATEVDLGIRPSPSFVDNLRTIAWGSVTDANLILAMLTSGRSSDSDEWHKVSHGYSAKLVSDFSTNRLLLLVLSDPTPRRRVVTVSYDEPYEAEFERDPLLVRLGWHPSRSLVPLPAISNCRSYEVEVEAPDGLEIANAELHATRTNGIARNDRQTNAAKRVHLELSRVIAGSTGRLEVGLRAPRDGFLTTAATSAVFSAVLLVIASCIPQRIASLESNADAMVALLLAIPAYMLANLAQPGEHAIVSRLLSSVRAAMMISGLALYAAAGAVVLSVAGAAFRVTLYVLTAVAITCGMALVVAIRHR